MEEKKSVWPLIFKVVKYAVIAALGYLTGDSDLINLL